jgi:pteridine reductase
MADMSGSKRVALITGGAQRGGRAIVETLAKNDFEIIFTFLSSGDEATKLVALLEAQSTRAAAVKLDLAQLDGALADVRKAVVEFGRLDVLVNCASMYEPDPAVLDAAFIERMRAVNVTAPVTLIESFAVELSASRGHVINMLDILAERPWPEYSTYCASKAELWNYTLSYARKLAPDVTINGIAPGVVAWPDDYPAEEKAKYLRRVPLGRAGTPDDVANLVHFLATQGTYITGQVIRLDGGRSIT